MKPINLSSLFTADTVASAFDGQIAIQASQGRTFAPLLTILATSYGIEVPAGTVSALKVLNLQIFQQPKAVTFAKGVGSVAGNQKVTQELHNYALALRDGMSASAKTTAPEVAPLPAWADPVAIAKRKEESLAKRKTAAKVVADSAVGSEDAGEDGKGSSDASAPKDISAEAAAAWATFAAYLKFEAITAAQRDTFIAALEKAVTKGEPVPKKTRIKAKVKAAPLVAAPDLLSAMAPALQ